MQYSKEGRLTPHGGGFTQPILQPVVIQHAWDAIQLTGIQGRRQLEAVAEVEQAAHAVKHALAWEGGGGLHRSAGAWREWVGSLNSSMAGVVCIIRHSR